MATEAEIMRIGLLCGRTLSEHHLQILRPILADPDMEVALAVVDARPPQSARRKVLEHLRRGRGGYILVLLAQKYFREHPRDESVREFCQANHIAFLETASPYSPQTAAEIRKYHLDLLALVSGFGIIREPLLSVCPKGILSYHHGDMRKYRGMPPGWWELYHGEREMGITVQKLAAGLDCGVPVEEKHIPIYHNDTLATLQARWRIEDEGMMHIALKKVSDPDFTPTVIHKFGKVYTLPNLRQWLTLHARIAYRRLRCRWPARSMEQLGSCPERSRKRS
jgi:folate-dependent phosphoribosylglycinamide formyltransferase PurN